jgi:hypothetical protein
MGAGTMRGMHEVTPIQDIFCSGIGAIEHIGGNCLRFYLYVSQTPESGDGPQEKVVVAKIVAPISAVPEAILQMIAAVGDHAVQVIPMIGDLMH